LGKCRNIGLLNKSKPYENVINIKLKNTNGDISKAQITFAPEFRLPFGEGSVFTATPNVMCRYLKQGTATENCGQGISLGFRSTSKDGLLNLTAKAGMDRIGNETTSTLGLQFEMRF
jgi:hypothetical protein